jgi:hypothetical protein
MNQLLHILVKDVRRLRWEIAATLLLTALLAWLNGDNRLLFPGSPQEQRLASLMHMLQPSSVFAWWFLILTLLHGEAIPGIRQFWITRPYRRASLLGAKLLFIVLFVNLPVFLADLLVLTRAGSPLSGLLPALLWKQVLFGAMFLLPAIGIAAVTAGFSQVVMAVIGLVVLNSLMAMIPGVSSGFWGGLGWWNTALLVLLLLLASSVLLYWQYFRRKTGWSRLFIALTVAAFFLVNSMISFRTAFSWQQRLAHRPGAGDSYTIKPATERGRNSWGSQTRVDPRYVQIGLPIDHQLPAGMEILSDHLEARLSLAAAIVDSGQWSESHGSPWIELSIRRDQFEKIRSQALQIDVTVFATLFGGKQTAAMPYGGGPRPVPGVGVCGTRDQGVLFVWCREAFSSKLWTRGSLWDRETGDRSLLDTLTHANYAPFHVDPGVSPLNNHVLQFRFGSKQRKDENLWNPRRLAATEIEFTSMEPLDHVVRTVRFDNVRLEDFQIIEPN